ncbi:hypothetical protein BU16DRAFT_536886 [Lophium mytilinum]|uniref:ADP-ribosylation n=1 Tax=Lophium mytilinum TaxID=390894 RepID=A0A6A6R3J0_9PEZI|nr:hypothetical protein BU16DRAFT_536886 [Lophium mytilinum]
MHLIRTLSALTATTLLIAPLTGLPLERQGGRSLQHSANSSSIAERGHAVVNLARDPAFIKSKPKPKPVKPKPKPKPAPKPQECKRGAGACDPEDSEDLGSAQYHTWGVERKDALDNKLEEVHRTPDQAHDKPITKPWKESYESGEGATDGEREDVPVDDEDLFHNVKSIFHNLGVNKNKETLFKSTNIFSKDEEGDSEQPTNSACFSTTEGDGVIVARTTYKKYDLNPENERLQWSELTFQQWSEYRKAAGFQSSDLKYIIRDGIVNKGSQNVIKDIWKNLNIDKDQEWETFDFSSTKAEEVEAAQTLLGTRNGKGVGYMLTDYPDALGKKNIAKVHAWNNDHPSIVFEFE